MRRLPFLVCALTLAAPATVQAAGHRTGGTAAPSLSGGVSYGQPLQKARRSSRLAHPVARAFTVAPATLRPGTPATFSFRVDGRMRQVRVRIELTRSGAPAPTTRLRLGYKRTGRRHTYAWTPAEGELPGGEYAVALHAVDDAGHALHRTATASGRVRLTVQVPPPPAASTAGVFPVQGPYAFGGEDARFGARRDGHVHQGQDVTAPEGTPLLAPVAGLVYWVAFQKRGAGHYVVLRGADGRDYVFMHLKADSVTAVEGAALGAGRQFAQVGSTGASSGPHVHFEIWPDGWYSSKDSLPIDPLPQLMAWAATR
ncbi:MAG: M23 family metallopeptidase [Solirubrobacteraceae bacterium]